MSESKYGEDWKDGEENMILAGDRRIIGTIKASDANKERFFLCVNVCKDFLNGALEMALTQGGLYKVFNSYKDREDVLKSRLKDAKGLLDMAQIVLYDTERFDMAHRVKAFLDQDKEGGH